MNKVFLATLTALFLLVILSLAFPKLGSVGMFSYQDVDSKIKNFYELALPGTQVEIVNKQEEHGMYKILVKVTSPLGTTYREAYVSKDGYLLTETPIFVETATEQINKSKSFVECLASRGVRIYGLSNQTQTLLQLNILGIYGRLLYVPCDGQLVNNCIAANVTQVPSVVINGNVYPGVKTIDWFIQATGCRF